ncbi:hypothetical protein EDB92DRAFT_780416 [Lactarius akahatsu]|uniref:Uncharacterized protein n=1 Tax=Lactarius akahatsu TaxID=416441 RepID=A0AAD4LFX9_9AGAM|nr:hypothetical protein EDB92DRAFT_780416 [Lactarius akahatsu]
MVELTVTFLSYLILLHQNFDSCESDPRSSKQRDRPSSRPSSRTLISRITFDPRSRFCNTSRAETTVYYDYDEALDKRTERCGLPSFVRSLFRN